MSDYIRRLVSGDKARFKDDSLDLELDLVYLTDRVIIMGYPADGFESLYRNKRDDAKRFLEHRHGKNFWVFNFCPLRENSYPASFFDGRVSRYPFPDHHAPPLALLPLAAREMTEWLDGAPERVIVLHCKAGKGRSGTLACTYLLAQEMRPDRPQSGLNRSDVASRDEWAKLKTSEVIEAIEQDREPVVIAPSSPSSSIHSVPQNTSESPQAFPDALHRVLDLHTARRMKAPQQDANGKQLKKGKQGVSIPSQRRWLYYWARLLSGQSPNGFWSLPSSISASSPPRRSHVRINYITVRMYEPTSLRLRIARTASAFMERTAKGKARAAHEETTGPVWISLARYDDQFVDLLERWEAHTRDSHFLGCRRPNTSSLDGESLREAFDDRGRWDKGKMVRSFARLGSAQDSVTKTDTPEGKVMQYTLRPLSDTAWVDVRAAIAESAVDVPADGPDIPGSEFSSIPSDSPQPPSSEGVVVDADREIRVKVYLGQIFLCWIWLIPSFHLPPPSELPGSTKLKLTRKETDFPIGLGSTLIDVEIDMEWVENGVVKATDSGEDSDGNKGLTLATALVGNDIQSTVHMGQATDS